jgi:hypothetical protein
MLGLAWEVHDLIAVEARKALESGWAELSLEEGDVGPALRLEPMKLACAPLEIYFDSAQLVLCSPGRKGMGCEFFSQDEEEIREQVRALAAALVAGSYVERLRDATSELVAEWPGPGGTEAARREALIATGASSGNWTTISYEPY